MDQRVINIPMGLEAGERNRHGMGFRCRGVGWRSADEGNNLISRGKHTRERGMYAKFKTGFIYW